VASGVARQALNGATSATCRRIIFAFVPHNLMSRPNLVSLFDSFHKIGSDIAFVEKTGYRRSRKSYAALSASSLLWSSALGGHGIGPGDRVLLWGSNSSDWVACFWAILLRGAVAVPMDVAANLEFVRRTAQEANVKLILRERTLPEIPGGPPSLVMNDFHDVVTSPAQAPNAQPDPGDASPRSAIAEILFTSGTTSEPRGVVLTHGNFLANLEPLEKGIDEYRRYERWFHPLRFVSLVPLSHVFGQFMTLFVPPLLGATVIFENSQQPQEILRTINREHATALVAVPRMLDAIRAALQQEIDSRGWRKWFASAYAAAQGESFLRRAWRFRRIHRRLGWKFWAFISGGAALSPQTEEFFKRIGYAVVQGYGMTETASLISLNHPFKAAEGSVGKILPGREFRLADDGEIMVRGENVSAGYWEKGAFQSASDVDGGWLRTGDLGELDAQGNLRFRGRKKNVIVTPAGLNIHPEDLEAALRKQPQIRDAVVVPIEIQGNAEPCAILLLAREESESTRVDSSRPVGAELAPHARSAATNPSDSLAQTAIASANSSLADYQRIRRWFLWPDPDFPRTNTGKPRLAILAARATELFAAQNNSGIAQNFPAAQADSVILSGEPAPFAGSQSKDPGNTATSQQSLTGAANDVSQLLSSSPNAALQNLSSLDRVELLGKLEHRYNIELNETQFANAKTIGDLQTLLAQPAPKRTDYAYPRWTQRAPIRWLRLLVYYALTWPATLFLAHPKILGRENLTALRGPVLFVSNHVTRRADIGIILFALPARFRHRLATAMGGETLRDLRHPPADCFFAKRWLFQLNYFLVVSLFNVFPLPQLSGFRESFRFAGDSVDRGYSILVFPEGIINDRNSPAMVPFQSGIGLLAQNLDLPIVPMRLDGVWQMKHERRRLAHAGELTVRIGAPITFLADTPPDEIATRLQDLVQSL
jgi:long-chain acyl-CoA synthetase